MSRFYRVSYAVGFHPWEDLAEHRPFADTLLALIEQEEGGRPPPYGQALDLGCGSAIWGVRLSARGWRVTGVDNVARALDRARARIRETGVEMGLVQGDVTRLRECDVGSGYDLVVDTGTFHGLTPAQRRDMGREVAAIRAERAAIQAHNWGGGGGGGAGGLTSISVAGAAGARPPPPPPPPPTRSRGSSGSTRCSTGSGVAFDSA